MSSDQKDLTKIIKKLLSDPRVVGVVTQVLAEILSEKSNIAENIKTKQSAQPKPQKQINWSEKSNATLRANHAYRKKKGIAIEPELNAELAARFPGYDAAQQIFTGRVKKEKTKKVRIINWAEKSDDILRKAYKHRQNTGIDDALNAELAARFPTEYDASTRKFVKKNNVHNVTTKGAQKSTTTTVVHRPVQATTTVAKTKPVEQPTTLTVTTKLVKQSLDSAFYNVYVNGKKILRNHANTKLKLFGDGTLLGVYGIVTNDKNLPQRPLWLIYETNLVQKKFSGHDKITKYDIYAKSVYDTPTGVNITLSTTGNQTLLLETEKLKRIAGLTRFEIEQ